MQGTFVSTRHVFVQLEMQQAARDMLACILLLICMPTCLQLSKSKNSQARRWPSSAYACILLLICMPTCLQLSKSEQFQARRCFALPLALSPSQQNRPTIEAKETHYRGKRDLQTPLALALALSLTSHFSIEELTHTLRKVCRSHLLERDLLS